MANPGCWTTLLIMLLHIAFGPAQIEGGDCSQLEPCRNGGTCQDGSAGAYTCDCPPGFSGEHCATAALGWDVAESDTIYISGAGTDNNSCGTRNQPCRTLPYVLREKTLPETVKLALQGGFTYQGCSDPNEPASFLVGSLVMGSYDGQATLADCQLIVATTDVTTPPSPLISLEDLYVQHLGIRPLDVVADVPRIYMRKVTLESFDLVFDASRVCNNVQLEILESDWRPVCVGSACGEVVDLPISCQNAEVYIEDSVMDVYLDITALDTLEMVVHSSQFLNRQEAVGIDMGVRVHLGEGDARVWIDETSFIEIPSSQGNIETTAALTLMREYEDMNGNEPEVVIDVRGCDFVNTSRAVALLLRGEASVAISGSTFYNNRAYGPGGAILLSQRTDVPHILPDETFANDIFTVTIDDCIFHSNDARGIWTYSPSLGHDINHQGSGGAILANFKSVSTEDSLTLTSNTFQNNTAEVAGGAYYLGPEILCSASGNHLENSYNYQHALFGDLVYATGQLVIDGDEFVMVTAGSRSSVIHFSNPLTQYLLLVEYTLECPLGYNIETYSSSNPTFTLPYALEAFYQYCMGCPRGEFPRQVSTLDYEVLTVNGEYQGIREDIEEVECFECPYGAVCSEGRIRARVDYWGSVHPTDGVLMQRCPEGYCCPDGACITYDECAEHRAGRLCARCEDGYTEVLSSATCIPDEQCVDHWPAWLVALALISLLFLLYTVFQAELSRLLAKLFDRTASFFKRHDPQGAPDEEARDWATHAGFLSIIFFYVQTAALLKVNILYSAERSLILQSITITVEDIFTFAYTSTLKDICLFPGMNPAVKQLLQSTFVVFMFAVLTLVALLYMVSRVCFSFNNHPKGPDAFLTRTAMGTRLITAFILLRLFTFHLITEVCLKLVQCVSMEGQQVLYIDATIVCYQGWQYAAIAVLIVTEVPLFVSFALGPYLLHKREITMPVFILSLIVPLVFAPYLIGKRVLLWQATKDGHTRHREWSTNPGCCGVSKGSIREVRGLLLGPFRGNMWANISWEGMIILRRLVLIMLAVFIRNPIGRLTALTSALLILLLIQVLVRPFYRRVSNTLEVFSLGVLNVVAVLNLVKATFLESEARPRGYLADLFYFYDWIELIAVALLPVLLIVIVAIAVLLLVLRRPHATRRPSHPSPWGGGRDGPYLHQPLPPPPPPVHQPHLSGWHAPVPAHTLAYPYPGPHH